MPRNYWRCPRCTWQIAWAFDDEGDDPDMGLVIGVHVEGQHPEMLDIKPPQLWRADLSSKLVRV